MTVARWQDPNYTTMQAASYKAAIDAAHKVAKRFANAFAPHQTYSGSPAPDRTVEIDAGFVLFGITLTEVAAQTVTGFTTPSAGTHRVDRVVIDASTGAASRVAGTAATGSPSATAPSIPAGKLPCCQVLITDSDTVITDSMITDERAALPVAREFASGTPMLFAQTAAPTGWTKSTTHNDKALRVVSGAASSGGATAFTSVFGAGKSTSGFTLTTTEMPAHSHGVPIGAIGGGLAGTTSDTGNAGYGATAQSSGSGGSHAHTLSLDLQYVDVIIATKD
jgi:hypothetical protein